MATDASFIMQMEGDIRYHSKQIILWQSRLNALHQRKARKGYKQGSKELYHSLMEFYGVTKGRQMWAAHLRKRREQETSIRRKIAFHRDQRMFFKNTLEVYVK